MVSSFPSPLPSSRSAEDLLLCLSTLFQQFYLFPCPIQLQSSSTLLIGNFFEQTTALKSIKSLAPLLDRVLVQRIKAEAKTASGIFLPESSVKELNEARVLAVGPGGLDKDGKRVSCSVAVGDKVLIPQVSLVFCFLFDGEEWVW
jgi:chaperonin GroES